MAWNETPPTDVEVGTPGHPGLHNEIGRAVAELQAAIDAVPAGAQGPAGPKGDTGAQGPAGSQGPAGPGITQAQFDALAARVEALENA